jgi:hypothetical protein
LRINTGHGAHNLTNGRHTSFGRLLHAANALFNAIANVLVDLFPILEGALQYRRGNA